MLALVRPFLFVAVVLLISAVAPITHAQIADPGATVVTPHETFPNPVHGSTHRVSAGCKLVTCDWAQGSTWTTGAVPSSSSKVIVDGKVEIRSNTATALDVGVYPAGTLSFKTDVVTELQTRNLFVFKGGTLIVGTAAQPITASTAIVIRNVALDSVADPKQHWNTLTSLDGTVTMHGRAVTSPFIRLSAAPAAGATTVRMESSAATAGWRVGDKILVVASDQCLAEQPTPCPQNHTEERTIAAISTDGLTLTLSSSLSFAHPAARDMAGTIIFYPHVINVTRNVTIRSENPTGVRGHVLMHARSDVDMRYVDLLSLGRTNLNNLGAANQKGRYPLHMHHVIGPLLPQANGRQYTLIGNVIDGGAENSTQRKKWGLTIHASHYGLIEKNVVRRMAGASLAAEDATETGNKWINNFAVTLLAGNGDRTQDRDPGDNSKLGRAGVHYWINGVGYLTEYVGNIGADNYVNDGSGKCPYCYTGFKFDNVSNGSAISVPTVQGADPYAGGGRTINPYDISWAQFEDQEVYAGRGGYTYWWVCSEFTTAHAGCSSLMKNTKAWHLSGWAFFPYESNDLTMDGLTVIGDKNVSRGFELVHLFAGSDYAQNGTFEAPTGGFVVKNFKIHGQRYLNGGFTNLGDDDGQTGTITLQDGEFSSTGSEWDTCAVGSTNGSDLRKQNIIFRNVTFRKDSTAESNWSALGFSQSCGGATFIDLSRSIKNTLENVTITGVTGAVNAVVYPNWAQQAQYIPGNCSRTAVSPIGGVVCLTSAPAPDTTPPTVSLTAPANNATVSGTTTAVSATAADAVGVVGVQFKLDGQNLGAEDTSSPYAVTWDTTTATNATHTLTATARDAAGNTTTSTAITVTVSNVAPDTTPPTVSLTAPANNATVSGTTTAVSATAADAVGVVGVQFKLDGQNLGAEDTSSPYAVTWDTTAATNASHTLTAVARDAAGNATTSTAVTVTVNNAPTPVPSITCDPLPEPTGTIVDVANITQLQNAITNLASDTTIRLASGTYTLADTLYLPQNISNVSVRGASGNRADVVIRGAGMAGAIRFGFWADNVTNVTFADMTVRDLAEHAFIMNGGVEAPHYYNVHMIDIGDQFIKNNPLTAGTEGVDNGTVDCSMLEYSTEAPDTYTNGVDVHSGKNWIIRNNTFKNIRTSAGLAGPAILMWNSSRDTVTQNNLFLNNQRGISYGLIDQPSGRTDHSGGIIRNNIFYRSATESGDVAIHVADGPNTKILNNTVMLNGTYPNAIEYRFAQTTNTEVRYNLTDSAIVALNSAAGTVNGNYTSATAAYFVNPGTNDLHLVDSIATRANAIDQALPHADVTVDYDNDTRPEGLTPDRGADEYKPGPAPVPNVDPTITVTPVSPFQVRIGQPLTFTVVSTDPDGDLVTLTFSNLADFTGATFE